MENSAEVKIGIVLELLKNEKLDEEKILSLLKTNLTPNVSGKNAYSLFKHAIIEGMVKLVNFFIDWKININHRFEAYHFSTPLYYATVEAKANKIKIIQALIQGGANYEEVSRDGFSYLRLAITTSDLSLVKFYHEKMKLPISGLTKPGKTYLRIAVEIGDVSIIKYLWIRDHNRFFEDENQLSAPAWAFILSVKICKKMKSDIKQCEEIIKKLLPDKHKKIMDTAYKSDSFDEMIKESDSSSLKQIRVKSQKIINIFYPGTFKLPCDEGGLNFEQTLKVIDINPNEEEVIESLENVNQERLSCTDFMRLLLSSIKASKNLVSTWLVQNIEFDQKDVLLWLKSEEADAVRKEFGNDLFIDGIILVAAAQRKVDLLASVLSSSEIKEIFKPKIISYVFRYNVPEIMVVFYKNNDISLMPESEKIFFIKQSIERDCVVVLKYFLGATPTEEFLLLCVRDLNLASDNLKNFCLHFLLIGCMQFGYLATIKEITKNNFNPSFYFPLLTRTLLELSLERVSFHRNNFEIVKIFCQKVGDLKKIETNQNGLLELPVISGHFETVKYLHQTYQLNPRESHGVFTPLMIASGYGHVDIVLYLIFEADAWVISDSKKSSFPELECAIVGYIRTVAKYRHISKKFIEDFVKTESHGFPMLVEHLKKTDKIEKILEEEKKVTFVHFDDFDKRKSENIKKTISILKKFAAMHDLKDQLNLLSKKYLSWQIINPKSDVNRLKLLSVLIYKNFENSSIVSVNPDEIKDRVLSFIFQFDDNPTIRDNQHEEIQIEICLAEINNDSKNIEFFLTSQKIIPHPRSRVPVTTIIDQDTISKQLTRESKELAETATTRAKKKKKKKKSPVGDSSNNNVANVLDVSLSTSAHSLFSNNNLVHKSPMTAVEYKDLQKNKMQEDKLKKERLDKIEEEKKLIADKVNRSQELANEVEEIKKTIKNSRFYATLQSELKSISEVLQCMNDSGVYDKFDKTLRGVIFRNALSCTLMRAAHCVYIIQKNHPKFLTADTDVMKNMRYVLMHREHVSDIEQLIVLAKEFVCAEIENKILDRKIFGLKNKFFQIQYLENILEQELSPCAIFSAICAKFKELSDLSAGLDLVTNTKAPDNILYLALVGCVSHLGEGMSKLKEKCPKVYQEIFSAIEKSSASGALIVDNVFLAKDLEDGVLSERITIFEMIRNDVGHSYVGSVADDSPSLLLTIPCDRLLSIADNSIAFLEKNPDLLSLSNQSLIKKLGQNNATINKLKDKQYDLITLSESNNNISTIHEDFEDHKMLKM